MGDFKEHGRRGVVTGRISRPEIACLIHPDAASLATLVASASLPARFWLCSPLHCRFHLASTQPASSFTRNAPTDLYACSAHILSIACFHLIRTYTCSFDQMSALKDSYSYFLFFSRIKYLKPRLNSKFFPGFSSFGFYS